MTTKNLTLNPTKSFRTEGSALETKVDVMDKQLSPKYEEKYKSVKQNEVIKQIEAQIQLHKRVKKPLQAARSVAISNPKELSNLANESRIAEEGVSHRRSMSTKDIPWSKLELPVRPHVVLERYSNNLAPHEREEVLKFPEIYYISDLGHKLPAKEEAECDDERGDYIVIRNDHINYRYEVLEMLGRGSFGQVVKVFDHKTKEEVALKIIRSPKKFHLQAKIEVKILNFMMKNQASDYNITELKDYFVFRKHVCLVFDLMSLNLYDFLKKNKFKGFSLSVIRKFAIQILYALKFLNQHKIIHCDLKPENILLKQLNKTGVKLIDFGSSCFESEKLYTYIQSRFYRSPEIILGLPYSTQIDMWSFGCLLCELYLGYPIFAGDSEQDQLLAMMEVLGVPKNELITPSPKRAKFFEDDLQPKIVPNNKGKIRKPSSTTVETILNCDDESFVDLVKHCLEYDPKERFRAIDALAHEWILKGLPPELKAQHMKLLEKNVTINTGRSGSLSANRDLGLHAPSSTANKETEGHQQALQKPAPTENVKNMTKHKKTFSQPIHRVDLASIEVQPVDVKAVELDDKLKTSSPQFKGKASMSIGHIMNPEESVANVTINLNESKLSSRASKRFSHTKQNSLVTPSALAQANSNTASGKDLKISSVNNYFHTGSSSQNISINLQRQPTLVSPKRVQTGRDGFEFGDLAHSGVRNASIVSINDPGYQTTTPKRGVFHKSLSLEKKLISPKGMGTKVKVFNLEDAGPRSAPRNNGFPTLQSPTAKKKS